MPARAYGIFQHDRNKRLIDKIRSNGSEILLIPPPIVTRTEETGKVALPGAGWMVFCDVQSADCFISAYPDGLDMDEYRICALGEAVADRLRFSQFHADVIPPLIDAESVFNSITEYEDVRGAGFLIVKRRGDDSQLEKLLTEAGADTTLLPVYSFADVPGLPRLRTILSGGGIDEFVFTSPQEVFDPGLYSDLDSIEFSISATDEITFQTLREHGLTPRYHKS